MTSPDPRSVAGCLASRRRARHAVNRAIVVIASAALLAACSGGSGGAYSSGGPGGSPGGNGASLSVSTHQLTVSAGLADAAPTASLQLIVTNPPATLYVGYQTTNNGISAVALGDATADTATIDISFWAPGTLGVGTYVDTLSLAACLDDACATQIASSPQTVSVTYVVTAGGGGGGGTPWLDGISPTSVVAGAPGFTLTVSGSGFTAGSSVQWNGSSRATTYVSPYQLTGQITAADVASAGSAVVTVSNAGGGGSNGITFTIQAPVALGLSAVYPSLVASGGRDFVLSAIGSGFVPSSTVTWSGAALPTTYVSPTELWASVSAADIASPGTASIAVQNPAATSSAATLVIGAPSKDAVSFQITPSHAGVIELDPVSFPTASTWSVDLGGEPSYALVAGGKVFVTVALSTSSEIVALDSATGTTVWGPISLSGYANAAYDGGRVFVISAGIGTAALVQALDAATGAPQWSTLLNTQYMFSSAITAANGMVYTGGAGSGGTVYAVNAANGAIAWTKGVANGDSSIPAVTADGVYVTYPCQTYDFRPGSGTSAWSNNSGCSGGGGGTPVVANGVLYAPNGFGSYDGITFDAETGALLGSYAADYVPAIGPTTGYFLQGGTLRGITLSNHTVQWSFAGDGHLVTSPIGVNDYVIVGSSAGNVYALDGTTGSQVWSVNVGAAVPAGAGWGARMPFSGLSAGGGLLMVPAGNTLTAYTLSATP